MAEEDTGATDVAEEQATDTGTEGAAEEKGVEFEGDFDPARAKRAIENARAEEAKLKQRLKEQAEKLAEYESAEAEKAEASKSLEQKIVERDQRIKDLEGQIEERDVKASFVTQAIERGYADPSLAFVAAKEQGLLGKYDRKSGSVGNHDFETLEESHPTFAAEAGRAGEYATGDAGARGARKPNDVGSAFNKTVRTAITGR